MINCLYDYKKKKWFPKKYKKLLSRIFLPIIDAKNAKNISFGTINCDDINTDTMYTLKNIIPSSEMGIFYIIKKIDDTCMYTIFIRDFNSVEMGFSDIRHSLKNYLNGLVIAEYESNGNNNIIIEASVEIDHLQFDSMLDIFYK